ncbi:MAG: hypothetical protein ACTHP8_13930 [Bosea sp. (in: a-proteobacteria)]|uniref:hypothetical protein n=1 Tax=Bosea sp. (in: a-proteobacteria) TaxID=1871050 RepID=UPI003F7C5F5E
MTAAHHSKSPVGDLSAVEAIDRLSEQVKFGHQAWLERLREMQDVEAEFAKELLSTREPGEALQVCNRWIARRLELLAADSRAFTGFWMDLVVTAVGSPRVPPSPPADGKSP